MMSRGLPLRALFVFCALWMDLKESFYNSAKCKKILLEIFSVH
jgi:hypothetical protein